jgi:hypothetical protein
MTRLDLPVDRIVRRQYVDRQLLVRRSVLASKRLWSEIDPKAIRATWHGNVGPRMVAMVTDAQTEAASQADPNVTAALKAQRIDHEQVARIRPEAFAGHASDGRDLGTLLELSNVYALQQIGLGATPSQGLAFGGQWLAGAVGLQVLDAARAAASASITVRHRSVGYYRDVGGSCCSRCAVLAGRWYRYNADFDRHTGCQCTQVPADEAGAEERVHDLPQRLFDEGRITDLSRADTQAIRDGADIGQVINAHRGMYSVTSRFSGKTRKFTREGTTRRGIAGKRLIAAGEKFQKEGTFNRVRIPRPVPEQIYRDAKDRDDAIRLLRRFGYIT